ncbi:MAG: hypothetical protein ABR908_17735 [Terriglobales bacterium]|jgi:hypothetical protein
MDADFSVELGREDPVLDFPWNDPADRIAYVDLKRNPELLATIDEVKKFPELGEFLRTVNSSPSMLQTAKCDVWETTELNAEEDIYNASHKFASYVDIVFTDNAERLALSAHEQFARKLVELLRRTPETPSAAEVCVRRCYYATEGKVREGCYCTLYVSGYGNDETTARQNWGVGLKLMGNAIVQLSAGG